VHPDLAMMYWTHLADTGRSLDRCAIAVGAGLDTAHPTAARWRRWFAGQSAATSGACATDPLLSPAQNEALRRSLHDELTLIHAPPGCGKGHLLATILARLVEKGERVLVTSHHPGTVERLFERLRLRRPDCWCFRLSPDAEVGTEILPSHDTAGVCAMTPENAAQPWFAAIVDQLPPHRDDGPWAPEVMRAACAAAWTSGTLPATTTWFDVVVIDDDVPCGLPQMLMAMLHGLRCVVVGDLRRIPSAEPVDHDADTSAYGMLSAVYPRGVVRLDCSYRMNAELASALGSLLYHRRLALPRSGGMQPGQAWLAACLDPERPVVFVSVTGTAQDTGEAAAGRIAALLLTRGLDPRDLAVVVDDARRVPALRISAITGVAQIPASHRALATAGIRAMSCVPADNAHGEEWECVVVVLPGAEQSPATSSWDPYVRMRRFTDAISLPRTKLIVVGDPAVHLAMPPVCAPLGRAWTMLFRDWHQARVRATEVVVVPSDDYI